MLGRCCLPLHFLALAAFAFLPIVCRAQNSSSAISEEQAMLAGSWSGTSYFDSSTPTYLFKPVKTMSAGDCLPQPGYPSKCPIEMMSVSLDQSEPGIDFNFTMTIFGDVFTSSKDSRGYYGMPAQCEYMRNHTGTAVLNVTSKTAKFTIGQTTHDESLCLQALTVAPGQRCGDTCYPNLVGETFDGSIEVWDMSTAQLNKAATDAAGSLPAADPLATAGIKMTLLFPYKNRGATGFSDYDFHRSATFQPTLTNKANDALAKDETFNLFLTKGAAYMPELWFADYRPKIESVFPPFGPEEGGTIVTITGRNFPMGRSDFNSNGSIVLEHSTVNPGGVGSSGGDERECCETWRLNSSQIMCRLPRTSCLTQVIGFSCPQPGLYFTNQTVSFAVKPAVKGFDGLAEAASIDRFIQYEGIWEIVDEDIYGGIYVPIKDRAPGEAHILNADNSVARESCCPVCPPGIPEADRAAQCRLTITQSQNGVYDVTVPETLTPGNAIRSGACDASTNYQNTTLRMTIETSVDPKGFTPKAPLSITNCPAGTGGIVTEACASVPRVSIRESCKQLIWSTGNPNSYLPPGETQEVHEWITNGQCDRRLRCVGGACMWSKLATNNDGTNWAEPPPPGYKTPVFQRRKSSAQIGLAVETNQPFFDSDGFMEKLGSLINATEKGRIQILNGNGGNEVQTDILGTTFAVRGRRSEGEEEEEEEEEEGGRGGSEEEGGVDSRGARRQTSSSVSEAEAINLALQAAAMAQANPSLNEFPGLGVGDQDFLARLKAAFKFELTQPALCAPVAPWIKTLGATECFKPRFIIYILADGPRAPANSEQFSQTRLLERAGAAIGDPEFRRLNLMNVCFDLSGDPISRANGVKFRCTKIQYPGFLQFQKTNIRVKENTWMYAQLGVTRTGGSDLGVTVDYKTVDYPNRAVNVANKKPALGLGIDFQSKMGQLRWIAGDALTKFINVPIMDDDVWELDETFDVVISSVVNASMSQATQTAVVTIVGMNDTPIPKYIDNMTVIIGAVVGVATILPLSLFLARLVRSIRRGSGSNKQGQRDVNAIVAHDADEKKKKQSGTTKVKFAQITN